MEDRTVSTVNIDTLLRGYQAFSSEIELDRLAQKIGIIIIENVGAERVCLLFEQDDEWIIAAENESARVHSEGVPLQTTTADKISPLVPVRLINHVKNSRKEMTLDGSRSDHQFVNDPYFLDRPTRSVLCLPLLNKERLNGILYLEKALGADAFTRDGLDVLRRLASPAAVSIENARRYASSRISEQKFRTIFEVSNDGIFIRGC